MVGVSSDMSGGPVPGTAAGDASPVSEAELENYLGKFCPHPVSLPIAEVYNGAAPWERELLQMLLRRRNGTVRVATHPSELGRVP